MPLRSPNDVILPTQVMTALASVMRLNTRLAGANVIYQNDYTPLLAQTTTFPCVVIHEATQSASKIAFRIWQRKLTLVAEYYDRWDTQTASISDIWALVDLDLRRMAANIEDNPTLTVNSVRAVKGVSRLDLSPYIGEAAAQGQALSGLNTPLPFPLVRRYLTMTMTLLPYTAAE